MRILLVEDERKLLESLSYLLKKNGYLVDTAQDGETGIEKASSGMYEVLILDRMLPGMDGVSLLREIRSMGLDTPVIFLTARDNAEDRVEGLDAGADDYLIKPFFADELLARLRALTRRKIKTMVGDCLQTANLLFYPLRCEVFKDSTSIHLTTKESQLLELLMINQGQVITKERIMEKVWGYNSEIEINNVDLYIHYLRKKLATDCIRTVRGVGYFLKDDKQYVSATAL